MDIKETPFTQTGLVTGDMGTPQALYTVAAGYTVKDIHLEVSNTSETAMDVHVTFTPSGGTAVEKIITMASVNDSVGWMVVLNGFCMATGDTLTIWTDAVSVVNYTLSGKLN